MVMEAMRLSLLDHEEQQRKEAAEKKKSEAEDPPEIESLAGPGPSTAQARSRTDSQLPGSSSSSPSTSVSATSSQPFVEPNPTDSAPVNSEAFNGQASRASCTNMSTGSTACHPFEPSSLSGTSSTANAILGIENSNALSIINGLSNGDQTPSKSKPITPPSEDGTFNGPSRVHISVPNSSSSISLSVPADSPTYDHLPSSPDSPSASESLLGSNAQMYPKTIRPAENGQEPLR
jgi:hypothetical protein